MLPSNNSLAKPQVQSTLRDWTLIITCSSAVLRGYARVLNWFNPCLRSTLTNSYVFHQAFFQGKIKIKGNMGLALKLKEIQPKPGKSKL